jgi:hypothetical protein
VRAVRRLAEVDESGTGQGCVMSARRNRRRRRLHFRCPETPTEWASLMLGVLTNDGREIVTRLELLIDRSHNHRLRNELLQAVHEILAFREYAESCVEVLAALAERQSGTGS